MRLTSCQCLWALMISWILNPAVAMAASISIWTRPAGDYTDGNQPQPKDLKAVELSKLSLTKLELTDVQYAAKAFYRGLSLQQLIDSAATNYQADTILLHFENAMVIPVPNSEQWKAKIFVALEYCQRKERCVPRFPNLSKLDELGKWRDPRPILFSFNKVVVEDKFLPALQGSAGAFSPWLHANTLTGVEFVNAAAYYKQFDFGDAAGLSVFRKRCQYCHAVRSVGAGLGWDFVVPLPVYTLRTPETLLNHIKYKKMQGLERGLLMPNQKDLKDEEAKAIWNWLKLAAEKPVQPYQP